MRQLCPIGETIAYLDEIDQWLRGRGLQSNDLIRKCRENIDPTKLHGSYLERAETICLHSRRDANEGITGKLRP